MKHVLVILSLVMVSFGAQASDCDKGFAAAIKINRFAEAGSAIAAKYECENEGGKGLVNAAANLCDYTAYQRNINLNLALGTCDRLEKTSWETLGVPAN